MAGRGTASGHARSAAPQALIAPDGTVAARFVPQAEPDAPELVAALEEQLPG
ncbi:hypothetical protein [Streptomyces sp. NPDC014733]|uniref:hypothetical protein n=1 Tax=Streptomyces sp. NPDC014733 TaxID=3364885 RepID=UPI00370283EA